MDKKNIIWELECAEANLNDDIQALAYIQDDLETTKNSTELLIKIQEVKNKIQILLKAMIYNQENMRHAVDQYYKEKEEHNNGSTSFNNSEKVVVENQQA